MDNTPQYTCTSFAHGTPVSKQKMLPTCSAHMYIMRHDCTRPLGDAEIQRERLRFVQNMKPALHSLLSLELRIHLIQCVPSAETAQATS